MARSWIALALVVSFALAAFGGRTVVHLRRHGDSGWRVGRAPGPAGVVVHGLLLVAAGLAVAAPVLALAAGGPHRPGGVGARGAGDGPLAGAAAVGGGVLAVLGVVVTLVAQRQMGPSWRVGVDPTERTALVTRGLFRHVRNPIFTGMGLATAGLALLVPNAAGLAAAVTTVVAVELQVRRVEEPYLADVHGAAYRRWAGATGRFLPRFPWPS
jgi:protein-S-isoprenylcysteine O-methyltransferase Ste14